MAGWDTLENLLREEMIQRGQEGCDISGFAERFTAAHGDETILMDIYHTLMELPIRDAFPFNEPNDLDSIRKDRPEGSYRLNDSLDEAQWQDKFLGAWLGRCSGCALGKPVEYAPFMAGTPSVPGWKNVQRWFEGADAWPIDGYTPLHSRAEGDGLSLAPWGRGCEREVIQSMPSDDDIRYTVLGLIMLEEKGLNFDSWDIGKLWHRLLAYGQVCTAETQAYLNFEQVTSHMRSDKPLDWTAKQEWVRLHLNPYREWIGAQIRADGWAYGAAGNPELAAELAWRDASFSHVKNGIYGEMFAAAMIAAAFVEDDESRIIEIGLSEIPGNCRLTHDVRKAVAIAEKSQTQLELVGQIWEAFKHYDPVHTNNNAALVAAALIFGRGDYEKAITTAVLGGWDTDCNGATVGSIMGAKLGAAALPEKWTAPLHDTLYAEVTGFHPIEISVCARRSYDVFRKLRTG